MMTFEDLNLTTPLRNALNDLGFTHPTPIQTEVFSSIASGRDVVGVAQTGTRKTFAFLLPILKNLKFSTDNYPRVCILVPTRELVVQTVAEVEKLTKYMTIRVAGVHGGTNINTQKIAVAKGIDIIVGTPGRTMDLCFSGVLKLKFVKQLVIDEVDEMMNLGFRTQLTNIFDLLSPKRQNLLFSATMNTEVSALIETFFENPEKIIVVPHGTPLEQIDQKAYNVPNFFTKANLLVKLLKEEESMSKVLVFVGTKKLADRLFELITPRFPELIGVIHSNKSQNFRLRQVAEFQDGTLQALIATDIIARGLDITEITHVVNFDFPEFPINYIHRIGRTGRADKMGKAISFVAEWEQEWKTEAEELMKLAIPMLEFPEDVEISDTLIPEEQPQSQGDKHYFRATTLKDSKGAFHEKKLKNQKVNRANEKRQARKLEKRQAKRKKKKKE